MLTPEKIRSEFAKLRTRTKKPINLNFFSHSPPALNNVREARWRERLAPYYRELGVDPAAAAPQASRAPFDSAALQAMFDIKPEVVSFQYALPDETLLAPLRDAGFLIVGCATTVAEARWLEKRAGLRPSSQGF
jgi:nitronate monooxygenase